MSGTLSDLGIRPLDIAESEAGSHPDLRHVLSESINLRDLAEATDLVQAGLILRSSQVVSPTQLKKLGVKTVIDLRQAPVLCKADAHNMRQSIIRTVHGAVHWVKRTIKRKKARIINGSSTSDFTQLLTSREQLAEEAAAPCWRCTETGEEQYGVHAQVYHVDLLPGAVTLFIFAALPRRLQLKVIFLKLTRRHPEPVVAAAVADPRIMGYSKLYQILLKRSKKNLVSALRLLLCEDHVPVLIHCIHGKDRTGLVVMLIYLLCGVPHSVIVRDYAQSESLLREGRDNRQLLNMPEEITTDEIIASQAHIMESTLDFLHEQYGDVTAYLRHAGMRHAEIIALRRLLQEERY